jgi:hypothetical protein
MEAAAMAALSSSSPTEPSSFTWLDETERKSIAALEKILGIAAQTLSARIGGARPTTAQVRLRHQRRPS